MGVRVRVRARARVSARARARVRVGATHRLSSWFEAHLKKYARLPICFLANLVRARARTRARARARAS